MSTVNNCLFGTVLPKVRHPVNKYLTKVVRIICLIYFYTIIEREVFTAVDQELPKMEDKISTVDKATGL